MAKQLSPDQMAKATARAINHTLAKSNTVAKRSILQRYNLHKTQVQGKRLQIKRAFPRKLDGRLNAGTKPIPLISFLGTHQSRAGVRVTVIRGKKQLIRGAFITTTHKGRRGVFARGEHTTGGIFHFRHKRIVKTGPDMPIEELSTVSIYSAGTAEPVQQGLTSLVNREYSNRLLHEMQVVITGVR